MRYLAGLMSGKQTTALQYQENLFCSCRPVTEAAVLYFSVGRQLQIMGVKVLGSLQLTKASDLLAHGPKEHSRSMLGSIYMV
jgi:hypothetical protein